MESHCSTSVLLHHLLQAFRPSLYVRGTIVSRIPVRRCLSELGWIIDDSGEDPISVIEDTRRVRMSQSKVVNEQTEAKVILPYVACKQPFVDRAQDQAPR